MQILFVSTVCSFDVFRKIFNESEIKPLQSIQKVYSLFLKGFPSSINITALSTPPVRNMKKRFVRFKKVVNQNISFVYIPYHSSSGLSEHQLSFLIQLSPLVVL